MGVVARQKLSNTSRDNTINDETWTNLQRNGDRAYGRMSDTELARRITSEAKQSAAAQQGWN